VNTLEDDIRAVLDRQANAMHVPKSHLDSAPTLIQVSAHPRPRHGWMLGTAAVLVGVVVAAVVLIERPSDKPAVTTITPPDTSIPNVITPVPQTSVVDSTIAATTTTQPPSTAVATTDLTSSELDPSLAGVLAAPTSDEFAQASDDNLYNYLTGHSEVTAQRRFVALRKCAHEGSLFPPCTGAEGWKYLAGSADSAEVHVGLLNTSNDLVVSPIDDRLFVASGVATAENPQEAPTAWLIDAISGERGELTWHDEPATFGSPEQELLLYPTHVHGYSNHGRDSERLLGFLPRVVDRRDWSVRPLRVPSDASAALSIHQPDSGRIWVGTAPDGGVVGLAYTDNGGASWTRVELPAALRPTSAELAGDVESDLLPVAASGDRVAVTKRWGGFGRPNEELFVTTNAGANWTAAQLEPTVEENAMEVFALADGRLVVAMGSDFATTRLFVSSSDSDWPRLVELPYPHTVMEPGVPYENPDLSHFDVSQRGVAGKYYGGDDQFVTVFSTDLNAWWTIPNSTWLFGR